MAFFCLVCALCRTLREAREHVKGGQITPLLPREEMANGWLVTLASASLLRGVCEYVCVVPRQGC